MPKSYLASLSHGLVSVVFAPFFNLSFFFLAPHGFCQGSVVVRVAAPLKPEAPGNSKSTSEVSENSLDLFGPPTGESGRGLQGSFRA